VAAASRI